MGIQANPRFPDPPAEMELLSLEGRYQLLFQDGLRGIVVQGPDGRIISTNAAAERILGLNHGQIQEHIQGRTSFDPRWRAIHEDGSPFPGQTHPAMVALATGRPVEGVVMGLHQPERGLRWIRLNSAPLFLPGTRKPCQVLTTFVDITEQRWNQAAMGHLDRAEWLAAGTDFFGAAMRFLAHLTELDHGYAARLSEGARTLRTLALWPEGADSAGREDPLAGSPFEQLAGSGICCIPHGARQRFPDCRLLRELKAESCLGTLLLSSRNLPIGLIALFGRRPLADPGLADSTLRLIALRAAAELELRHTG